MTAIRVVLLGCDGCGFYGPSRNAAAPSVDEQVRSKAARHGWTHPDKDRDLCPRCSLDPDGIVSRTRLGVPFVTGDAFWTDVGIAERDNHGQWLFRSGTVACRNDRAALAAVGRNNGEFVVRGGRPVHTDQDWKAALGAVQDPAGPS